MNANELIEEGARVAKIMLDEEENQRYTSSEVEHLLLSARAVIAMTLKAAAEEIESQLRMSCTCEMCIARIIDSKRLRALAEQVEKANG